MKAIVKNYRFIRLILFTTSFFFVLIVAVFAATTDFVSDGNITVESITYSGGSADAIIMDNSSAESFTYDGGVLTVTNPDTTNTFKVGSGDAGVKTLRVLNGLGETVACAVNSVAGTSYVEFPTTTTYTLELSETTDCQSLCSAIANTASYNPYPTCGVFTCVNGYQLSNGACVSIGFGCRNCVSVCDRYTISEVVPVPGSTVDLLEEISFQAPVDTDTNSISVKINNQKVENSFKEKKDGTYEITADVSSLIISPGEIKVDLYVNKKGNSCRNSSIYYITTNSVHQADSQNFDIDISVDSFSDVDSNEWYAPFVEKLKERGTVSGYPDKTFRPSNLLNRAEISKIAVTAFGLDISQSVDDLPFVDVPKDAWFAAYVNALYQADMIGGYEEVVPDFDYPLEIGSYGDDVKKLQELLIETGYYKGSISNYFGPLTQEAVILFQSAYPETIADGLGIVGEKTVTKIIELTGYTENGTTRKVFRPDQPVTRAEALKILLNASGLSIASAIEQIFPDVLLNDWFVDFVNFAKVESIIDGILDSDSGIKLFKPNQTMTRAEMAKIVDLIIKLLGV